VNAPRRERVGLVDVGSNAVRTRVVEVVPEGETVLHDERTAIRVGREVFLTGALGPATIAAVADALAKFRSVCDRLGARAIRAVATSAARSASNGAELVDAVRGASGIELQIIDGEREAALLFAAVARRTDLGTADAVLADLGAGSLELVVLERGAQRSAASHPLGSLRLFDALPAEGKAALGPDLLAAIDALLDARAATARAQLQGVRPHRVLGIGSSVDVVADLERAAGRPYRIDGCDAVPAAALHDWRARLAALPAAERTRRYDLSADRADLVVVALSVYAWLLRELALDALLVPRVSLRDGLLAEWLRGAP